MNYPTKNIDIFCLFLMILLKNKFETDPGLEGFYVWVRTQFDAKIGIIQTDIGKESDRQGFYLENDITHKKSCIETLQQNDRIERKHQQILKSSF